MSRCGRTALLEPMVAGELSAATAEELHAHARSCQICHHELNWLLTESRLFRERASREEVAYLWKGVAQRTRPTPPRAWARLLMTGAATLLLLLTAGRLGLSAVQHHGHSAQLVSEELVESSALASLQPDALCSRLPEGLGFHCAPAVPASFLASR